MQDITERKKAEEALKESEVRFKGIFESKLIGTFIWDANGNITYANDVYLEMVGYSKDEVLSGTIRWRDLTPPEYTDLDNKALEEIATTGVMTPIEKEYIHFRYFTSDSINFCSVFLRLIAYWMDRANNTLVNCSLTI